MAAKKGKSDQDDRVIENRKARFNYTILSTLEVGIVLRGSEVKSVRDGKVSISESYVRVDQNPPAMYAHGINIDAYGPSGPIQHTPKRTRLLLAHKREIRKFAKQLDVKGFTIVPLKLYFKDGYAKLLVGVAEGKTKGDKRQTIAKRDSEREVRRAMSRRARDH
jgi:SsrA-binding protein